MTIQVQLYVELAICYDAVYIIFIGIFTIQYIYNRISNLMYILYNIILLWQYVWFSKPIGLCVTCVKVTCSDTATDVQFI